MTIGEVAMESIQQPLFDFCARPAPLRERAKDLLQYRELLIEAGHGP
jgi:hypothetical protein